LPEIAMKPADAYDQLVRGEVEAVSIDALDGRIAAVMLVPYPPGIPLIMPGERFTESTRSIIDYLKFARTFDSSFPGFVADVHGLQHEDEGNGRHYTVDCIRNEDLSQYATGHKSDLPRAVGASRRRRFCRLHLGQRFQF
jgi:arginine decarboxylase